MAMLPSRRAFETEFASKAPLAPSSCAGRVKVRLMVDGALRQNAGAGPGQRPDRRGYGGQTRAQASFSNSVTCYAPRFECRSSGVPKAATILHLISIYQLRRSGLRPAACTPAGYAADMYLVPRSACFPSSPHHAGIAQSHAVESESVAWDEFIALVAPRPARRSSESRQGEVARRQPPATRRFDSCWPLAAMNPATG